MSATSKLGQLAEAVAVALNAHAFSQVFTAELVYVPKTDLADATELRVQVVPRAREVELVSRAAVQTDYRVDVGIIKKLDGADATATDNDQIDVLSALVEEIIAFLAGTRVFGPGLWLRTENAPAVAAEQLRNERTFASVLQVTVRTVA